MLYGPTLIFLEDGPDFEEEVGLEEGLVRAVVRPDAEQARAVTAAKPVGDLLDGGLFEVVGERGMACVGSVAGQNISSAIGYASESRVDSG